MTARMWHPGIAEADGDAGAYTEVDDSAVPVLRNAGWLLASERDEHLERIAAHPSQSEEARAKFAADVAELEAAAAKTAADEAAPKKPRARPGGAADTPPGGTEGS